MPSIVIDGAAIRAEEGITILEAARSAGIVIPHLCYLKERSAIASCRLCVVELAEAQHPVPACTTPVREGMEIKTQSAKLSAYRKMALELILASKGPSLAALARKDGVAHTQLAALCAKLGLEPDEDLKFSFAQDQTRPLLDDNPFLRFDPNLCISCQRCIGVCNNAARNHSLQTEKCGIDTLIRAPFGPKWRASECESCGNCAQACPTGAISLKARPLNIEPSTSFVRTTCPHCGVGCQLELEVSGGRIVAARGASGASNRSLLCVKGRSASFDFVQAPDRLTTPLVRNPQSGELEPATWDEALEIVASRLGAIRDEYGGKALAAFACSRSTNEDVYLFQKMARVAFKTNNIDCCARV